MKTGFTDSAKYCMAVTAKRDNMRLIAIVLGEESGKVRNQETMELLDYGFNLYKVDLIKDKNDEIGELKIDKANNDKIKVYAKDDITVLGKKSDVSLNYDIVLKLNDVKLPLKKNSVVGKISIMSGNKKIKEIDAIVKEDINKISFINLFGKTIKDVLSGNVI